MFAKLSQLQPLVRLEQGIVQQIYSRIDEADAAEQNKLKSVLLKMNSQIGLIHSLFAVVNNTLDAEHPQYDSLQMNINNLTSSLTRSLSESMIDTLIPNEDPLYYQGTRFQVSSFLVTQKRFLSLMVSKNKKAINDQLADQELTDTDYRILDSTDDILYRVHVQNYQTN